MILAGARGFVTGDRRQASWNNYLVDEVSADLRMQKLDLVFRTANTMLFGLDRLWVGLGRGAELEERRQGFIVGPPVSGLVANQ